MDELAGIKEQLAAMQQRGRLDKLMSNYGEKFGNDESIGLQILAGLQSKGADLDNIIEDVLNQYLQEVMAEAQAAQAQLGALLEKIGKTQEAVDEALAGQGKMPETPEVADAGMEPGPDAAGGPPPPDMGGAEGAPPPDAGAGEPPPPPAGDMPPDAGAPPAPPSEGGMVSDERLKNIRPTILSDARLKTRKLSDEHIENLRVLSDEAFKDFSDDDLLTASGVLSDEDEKENKQSTAHASVPGPATMSDEDEKENKSPVDKDSEFLKSHGKFESPERVLKALLEAGVVPDDMKEEVEAMISGSSEKDSDAGENLYGLYDNMEKEGDPEPSEGHSDDSVDEGDIITKALLSGRR